MYATLISLIVNELLHEPFARLIQVTLATSESDLAMQDKMLDEFKDKLP